jgi:putative flavoprotein involved in K+ transport
MTESIETIIIGGGQAGLATSYCLNLLGCDNLVLEQANQPGNAWRNGRWDSFTLVTPNWSVQLPGAEYQGDDPQGFLPRDDIVAYFEHYVERHRLPVRFGIRAVSVEPDDSGYLVKTDGISFKASNVVIATGLFQKPKDPPFSANLPASILQLHSGEYRNPQALPPGAVLVVGSAQSGCQIAEELTQSGRKVYLCVGSTGRVPRHYRGKDIVEWFNLVGLFDRTPDKLPSPRAKFAGNPHLSGKNGGHTINLHQFARDGVTLLGRLQDVQDGKALIAPDLMENLAKVDRFEADIQKRIDGYIEINKLESPEEILPVLRDGYETPILTELELKASGIGTVIWALGYHFDFSLVKLPVLDQDGFPLQNEGVTVYPGLYFVGMPWMATQKSGLLLGVGKYAAAIAEHIASRGVKRRVERSHLEYPGQADSQTA